VIGNVIGQSATTTNPTVVSYGAEGAPWDRNALYLVNNTLVDSLPQGGEFVHVYPDAGRVLAVNNVLLGKGAFRLGTRDDPGTNFRAQPRDFVSVPGMDYRLRSGSGLRGMAVDPGQAHGIRLRPTREYVQPASSRAVPAGRYNPGAMQTLAP